MSNRIPLIITTIAAAALFPAAASADSPATPADRGNSTPITEARLDGSRLTVSLRCRRTATVTVAGANRRVTCRDGRGRAQFRVRPDARVKIAVRSDGRSTGATLPFGAKPGRARAAAWQTWRDGYAECLHTDLNGNRNPLRIGITRSSSFGLPFGERFSWMTWIYWVDARTGASGFTSYGRWAMGYAGLNGVYTGSQLWSINPGYWIRPAIQVAGSTSDWNFVNVTAGFPSPAYDANWCRY